MPAESGRPELTKITNIIIWKGRITAVTSLGHITIWNQKLLDDAFNNNTDILSD
jgi:hypothetical protein